ncbi:MAG: c-type cytochrome domain-containing protein [Bacteroidia bacterium]
MNKVFLFFLFAFLAFCSIQSCKHNPSDIIPNIIDTTINDTTKGKRPCNPDTVYYIRDIQPIFTMYCAGSGCHSGSRPEKDIDLTTYTKALGSGKIKPYNSAGSKVYQSIIDPDPGDRMPASAALSADKIALIKKWIDQGAKDLICDDISKPCDTTNVTYSKTIVPILTANCTGCHGLSGGVTLTSYSGVKNVVNNGKLWNAINHLAGPTKAMPNSTTKLSNCNLRQIKIWIEAGAPQN